MSKLRSICYDELAIGQQAQFSKTLTQELVQMFAAVSGDLNPVHLDAEFAATTAFASPIGHGAWVSSLISAAIAMHLPGPGTIYRSQQISFKKPARIGDTLTVTIEVLEKKDRNKLVTLDCQIANQDGVTLARGIAEVIAPAEAIIVDMPEEPRFTLDA